MFFFIIWPSNYNISDIYWFYCNCQIFSPSQPISSKYLTTTIMTICLYIYMCKELNLTRKIPIRLAGQSVISGWNPMFDRYVMCLMVQCSFSPLLATAAKAEIPMVEMCRAARPPVIDWTAGVARAKFEYLERDQAWTMELARLKENRKGIKVWISILHV
jgi:hypothetical protein